MERAAELLRLIDNMVWGPPMLALMLGTGIYLMVRMKFLPVRNLGYALKSVTGGVKHTNEKGEGDISSFSSLMTELAATIGTGNIVGVATAMVLGGPGALVWMMLSAFVGFSTKLAESLLSVKYRTVNKNGEISGGPMYTMRDALPNQKLGKMCGIFFAVFAVLASFGMGNMTQANSISASLRETFGISEGLTGLAVTLASILVILGGIKSISKVTCVAVPCMAVFYMAGALIVIVTHLQNLPAGIHQILTMAFSPKAVAGGAGGTIVASMQQSVRWGVSRGVFSNEAGLGAAGISAAAADTDDPVQQGYVSMTGVFFDTIVICLVTGLAISASGVLGMTDAAGVPITGSALTIAAFTTTFGVWGGRLVSIGIVLFAFATIIGWEYQGEKAFEFLTGNPAYSMIYRFVYALTAFVGATCALDIVWDFSDIMNALMALPNLFTVLWLSPVACKEVFRYQKKIKSWSVFENSFL